MGHRLNTGHDYAKGLFKKGKGELDLLLKVSRNQENGWLEFKADPFCRENVKGERQDDYSWHILRAVIAFANTCGGCILIGVDDNGKSLPLMDKESGEETTLDKYSRKLQSVLFDKKSFSIRNPNEKNPNRIRIEVDNERCYRLTEMEAGRLDGRDVLVLLVKESEDPLLYEEDGQQKMLVRNTSCQVGAKNQLLTMSQALNYIRPEIQPLQEYYSSIPSPNSCFVGRLDELKKLHGLLSEIPPRIPLIHGPAGTGKTELAFRYAETWRDAYESCIYLRAENITGIPEGFHQILQDPQLVEKYGIEIPSGAISLDKEFQIIRDALLTRGKGDILILFDNLGNTGVLNPSEIRKYLTVPGGEKLHIYATTLRDNLQVTENDTVQPFKLGGLPESDGLELLEKKRPCDNKEEKKAARELVEYLDGNAWALDLIGEDLKQRHPKYDNDYRDWLEKIKKEPVKAFSEAGELETVRIKHGCLDPVKLLDPTLKRLNPIARSFADTAALCNPDFIYTGWLKGVYQRKTKEDISVRKFNSAIMELKDAHIFNQRAEEVQETPVYSSGQEIYEVIKLHRLTRGVLRTRLGENLKKEQLVFRKYFLRELLNVLHVGNREYEGIADSLPKAGAGVAGTALKCSIGGIFGGITSSLADFSRSRLAESRTREAGGSGPSPETLSPIPFSESSVMLRKAIGLDVFEPEKKENLKNWKTVAGIAGGVLGGSAGGVLGTTAGMLGGKVIASTAGGLLGGPLGWLLGGAVVAGIGAAAVAVSSGKDPKSTSSAEECSSELEDLQSCISKAREEISPSPEWMQTVRLFLLSFEEIRNDLDAEDIHCVREFLHICCDKLSRLEVFSALHDRKSEMLGVELLFRLYPVVTETLKDPQSEEIYLNTAAVLYNNLINYFQTGKTEERTRLKDCLKFFIEQVKKWSENLRLKLDGELEDMSMTAGKRFKPLAEVQFPDPVFCEMI